MPGINNIGGRTLKRMAGLGKLYQSNQNPKKAKSDPKGKLVIQNYAKDLNLMIFWGWDVIAADELDESYIFQLAHRTEPKLRVYITLGRDLQYAELPYYPEMMYQCYIHDDEGKWEDRSWFRAHDITYKNFWSLVEEVVDKHHSILPF